VHRSVQEEIRKLRSELELQTELKGLQAPVKTVNSAPLDQVMKENKTLASAIQQQQFGMARTRSTLPPSSVHDHAT